MGGYIFYRVEQLLYMNIISDVFCSEILGEFLLEEFGSSSSGEENIFQKELLRDICHSNKYRVKENFEKYIEHFFVFLVCLFDVSNVVFNIKISKFRFFLFESLFEKSKSEIERISSENFSSVEHDYSRF